MVNTNDKAAAQHTPGLVRVTVNGRDCEVYKGTDGKVQFVRLALATKGDSQATRRTLRLDGPLARAAITKATGPQGGAA